MGLFQTLLVRANRWHSIRSYEALVARKRRKHKGDRDMAMMAAIGAQSRDDFARQGDGHVAVLRHHGLRDGMSVYDLGCGSGRTAIALRRSGWQGQYKGADVIRALVKYLRSQCPDYEAIVHRGLDISAPNDSIDMLFHWSVFTHLYPEECYLYLQDTFRALKPGGKLVFSFLEMEDARHHPVFRYRIEKLQSGGWASPLDSFLHRDWIRSWARDIGFENLSFTSGTDSSHHAEFWQALAVMSKPV